MGTVLTHKAVGGGLPELGPWKVEVREPVSFDSSGYAYFDVGDLMTSGTYCVLLGVATGVREGYTSYAAVYSGKVYNGTVTMSDCPGMRGQSNHGAGTVLMESMVTNNAFVSGQRLKMHIRPDTTSGGTYTAQGGLLLVLRP